MVCKQKLQTKRAIESKYRCSLLTLRCSLFTVRCSLFTILCIFQTIYSFSQEPGWSGFKFRLFDQNNEIVTPQNQEKLNIRILFKPHNNGLKCPTNKKYLSSIHDMDTNSLNSSFHLILENYSGIYGFDYQSNSYTFQMWAAPSFPCSPSFMIIQNSDTMFVRSNEILGCYFGRKNESKMEHCQSFEIHFEKGYNYLNKVLDVEGKTRLQQYFKNELKTYFCFWEEMR